MDLPLKILVIVIGLIIAFAMLALFTASLGHSGENIITSIQSWLLGTGKI